MAKTLLTLRVNGETHSVAAEPHHTLLEVLREEMGLTGTKHGCELGECGACTVLVDGTPVLSCLTLPIELDGAEVTTVEGLAKGPELHPLQTAFAEEGEFETARQIATETAPEAKPEISVETKSEGVKSTPRKRRSAFSRSRAA